MTFVSKLASIPGPPPLPFVGNALDFNVPKKEVLVAFNKIFLGMQPYIVFANAANTESILGSKTQIEKSADYNVLQDWLGRGILTSGGENWYHRRRKLNPAFHYTILGDCLRIFNEQSVAFKAVLEGKLEKNQAFDIVPVITHCALDIICETAMGRRFFVLQKSDSEYVKAIYRLSELVQHRQFRPWLHPNLIWWLSPAGRKNERCLKIVHGFTDLVIKEKKQERRKMMKKSSGKSMTVEDTDSVYMSSPKKKLAFLDLLLDAQETDATLTDKNIREETDIFMFAGHDTTSAATSWTTFLLSLHPECQAKVHQELDDIFGSDRSREVTVSDLAKMKYHKCCIKEGLRLFPSGPFVAKRLTHDQSLDDGTVLPQGVTALCLIYFLHRDPKVFPNPKKFDPDRFKHDEAEGVPGKHPFAYIPFSAGPRNCIGQKFAMMEEKVLISTIFRNFKVHAAQRMEDVNVLCEVFTRPEAGLLVTLEKR